MGDLTIGPATPDDLIRLARDDYDLNPDRATLPLTRATVRALLDRLAEVDAENRRLRHAYSDASLVAAWQQLAYWWEDHGRCPCGARREALASHPHVTGCPTAWATGQYDPSPSGGSGRPSDG